MKPLVSVLMPVFNVADTLPLALASLQAQTFDNWECIIVDDGSADNSKELIAKIGDPRIQYHPLGRNHGRGYARQTALEIANGEYIAFLDGDDWLYPTKLWDQLGLFSTDSDLAVVSSGMAISNLKGQFVGVRVPGKGQVVVRDSMRCTGMPPLAFAPSMLPAALAKQTGFDISFPTAEDADFLLRALMGKRYAVIPAPLYVYCEQGTMTLSKVSVALSYSCRMFAKHLDKHPLRCSFEIAKARGKQVAYHAAAAIGYWERIIARRSRAASGAERANYQQALETVSLIAKSESPREATGLA